MNAFMAFVADVYVIVFGTVIGYKASGNLAVGLLTGAVVGAYGYYCYYTGYTRARDQWSKHD